MPTRMMGLGGIFLSLTKPLHESPNGGKKHFNPLTIVNCQVLTSPYRPLHCGETAYPAWLIWVNWRGFSLVSAR
jgi:hypothetical protein